MESKLLSVSNLTSLEEGQEPSEILGTMCVSMCVKFLGKESIAFNRLSKVLGHLVLDSFADIVAASS